MNCRQAAEMFEGVFRKIHTEGMAGIPLLNPVLKVQTVGFCTDHGRITGVLITPWMMSLVMLPGDGDDWDGLDLGKKVTHQFPSNSYKFMVNDIEGIGRLQMHSLYSPMREFVSQDHAVAVARRFCEDLKDEVRAQNADPVDEELLGRILRGEQTPELDLDGSAGDGSPHTASAEVPSRVPVRTEKKLSRRALLRGRPAADS